MINRVFLILFLLTISIIGCQSTPKVVQPATTAQASQSTANAPLTSPSNPPSQTGDIYSTLSKDSLLGYIEKFSTIQPYSGWRTSATRGEAQALDYVNTVLGDFVYLKKLGLEFERQSFHIYNTTQQWENHLVLTMDGMDVEVPANGLRGARDDLKLAMRFDSDGKLNDSDPNPLTAEGEVVLVQSLQDTETMIPENTTGKIIFIDYAAIDRIALGNDQQPYQLVARLYELKPGGVVLVTHNSNQPQKSHGSFVGDSNAFIFTKTNQEVPVIPILATRLEDLGSVNIKSWDDLKKLEKAQLAWDSDVFSPAESGNLVVRIPGKDTSRAVILSAHIDSPNAPGALDDGSGSAILLETARVLNSAQVQPAVDLYLVWYGSEEMGLWGSTYFIATHQELLDRTIAMLQTDMLSRPLDGINADIYLNDWVYSPTGGQSTPWSDYLRKESASLAVNVLTSSDPYVSSDNWGYAGFDVPNANMIYMAPEMQKYGSLHYAAHIHDPYDTVEQAREQSDTLVKMARVALSAGLETGQTKPNFRTNPVATHRALFIASHTEALTMSPAGFTEVGQTLAEKGYDVDMLPYGQAVTPADLEKTDLVIVLPVIDLPSQDGDLSLYDESWGEKEIAALENYVANGGLLVLTNSARRLGFIGRVLEPNEDWQKMNSLAERFGVQYQDKKLTEFIAKPLENSDGAHGALMKNVVYLEFLEGNAVPFTMKSGQSLATTNDQTTAGLIKYRDKGGQVVALADVGSMYFAKMGVPRNLPFWQNLASFALTR